MHPQIKDQDGPLAKLICLAGTTTTLSALSFSIMKYPDALILLCRCLTSKIIFILLMDDLIIIFLCF